MSDAPFFTCPSCGGKKLWKSVMAGKRAKCGCGSIIAIPDAPMVFAPAGVVIEREEADGSISTIATRKTEVIHSDRLAVPGRKALTREVKPEPQSSTLRDYILPAILILVGLTLCFIDGSYRGEEAPKPMREVSGEVMLNILASLVFAIGAVFAASAMGGVAFIEPVPVIIYKLCGIALAPGAIGSILTHAIGGINGEMLGIFVSLGCYFGLFVLLFRMSMSDRVVCVALLFIMRTVVAYALYKIQGARQGAWF